MAADRPELPPRAVAWAHTMYGHGNEGVVRAHRDSHAVVGRQPVLDREAREERERLSLRPGSSFASGAGERAIPETPDPERTCFERDRDRIVHSSAFRRLAGKTQVVVDPLDHQRTRLTHAIEVAQVATSIARGVGVNVTLADTIALGHDCGHGPGGHASEDAFDEFLADGYDHGPWGADVVLSPLNLCRQTLDGIRNHSWSRPAPSTIEGEIVSWSDRIAYCAHDLEDALHAKIITVDDIPAEITEVVGTERRVQLGTFIRAVIGTVDVHGEVGMPPREAAALAALRKFNYERIYTRPDAVEQSRRVVDVLRALVEHYLAVPWTIPDAPQVDPGTAQAVHEAVRYVGGMTDRYAFEQAIRLLDWDPARLPQGVDRH